MTKARELYDVRLAERFNPLDFGRLDELGLSRLIGWLLDPKGSHAQGGRFLKEFTRLCGHEWSAEDCAKAVVRLEHTFANSRIDILVRSTATLAIENKPWAIDQEAQLARYLSHISTLSTFGHQLIYLTPTGHTPPPSSLSGAECEAALEADRLVLLSYRHSLDEWLERCRQICEAPRVASFIEDIRRQFAKYFGETLNSTDLENVASIALATQDTIRSALQIANAKRQMHNKLLGVLRDQLNAAATGVGLTLVWEVSDARWSGFSFVYEANSPFVIRYEFERQSLGGMFFGIKKSPNSTQNDLQIAREHLKTVLGASRSLANGPWAWNRGSILNDPICQLPWDWNEAVEVWAGVLDGSTAAEIMKGVRLLLNAVRSLPKSP